jgi:hypothetical protein
MTNTKDTTSGGLFEDFKMFSVAGNAAVADIVQEARELAGLDGPINPVQQAIEWMFQELEHLSSEHFKEADRTAIRDAALLQFFKEED